MTNATPKLDTRESAELNRFVDDNMRWLEGYVRKNLGRSFRGKHLTRDFVHEGLLHFISYVRTRPEYLKDAKHLRRLLARVTRNALIDKIRYGKVRDEVTAHGGGPHSDDHARCGRYAFPVQQSSQERRRGTCAARASPAQ